MVKPLLWLLITIAVVSADFDRNALSFSITPNRISMCGSHVTTVMRIECRLTKTFTQFFSIEIGKKTSTGSNVPIARIMNDDQYSLKVLDNSLKRRLTQTNWDTGWLSVNLDHPGLTDLDTYYCSAAFISGPLIYSEAIVDVVAEDLKGQVPVCSPNNVDGAVAHQLTLTHSLAGKCPDGTETRPEALNLNYCRSPDVSQWQAGPKVMDICCQIPTYTPVAAFVFGVYVEDEHGVSGVFLGCKNNGFSMALQLCGHPPVIVNLTRNSGSGVVEDPDNYNIVLYSQSHRGPITG